MGGEPIAGRFRLERVLGAGGMGTVYRAHDLENDAPVALKLLTEKGPSDLERFARESRVLAELRHPHVVRWVAHGTTSTGDPFLAMEWLDGEDLAQRLRRAPLTANESVRLAVRVADALASAHELGVVHRDIKPANLFLPNGSVDDVRVLDFGIARSARDSGMTRTGAVLGTIGYMAPEQLRGERDVGPAADVFALGCVLFECLARRPAFAAAHAMAVVIKILLEDAPRVRELEPSIGAALDELVAKMLMREHTERIGSCAEVVKSLRAIEADATPASPSAWRVALTASEQRVVSMILAASAPAPVEKGSPALAATDLSPLPASPSAGARTTPHRSALHAAVEPFGASLEIPSDGMVVALLSEEGAPAERAARAAGCALAMRPLLPDVPMVLVTGLCVLSDRLPLGPIVDRAVAELRSATRDGIRIDELTDALIADRFQIIKSDGGLTLVGVRDTPDDVATLLGQRSPYVGRERETSTLNAVFDECVADEVSRVAVVVGPPGMGKSRLLKEALVGMRQRAPSLTILQGRGDAVTPGVTFGILGRAIRALAGILDGDPAEKKRERLAELVMRRLPAEERGAVVPFIGELAGVAFDDAEDAALRTARMNPSLMNDRLEAAWLRWLTVLCEAGPVLIVLEDLHWGDAATVRYVDRALDALGERPLMVLATGRPELAELFPSLWKSRSRTEILLGGLSKRSAERLVRTVLGEQVPKEQISRLVERADGNPLFLEELLRYAAKGRTDTLPTSMIGIVTMRLADLESETRRLLRAASIIGETFWAGSVAHLTGERPAAVALRIEDLVARELITRRATSSFAGDQELAFRHALVREVAYATLTDADRALGHRLAGEWLEAAGSPDPSILASHFEHAGDRSRAAGWYARAAELALEVNDLDAALVRAERGLACDPEARVEASLHHVSGRAIRWRGELEKAASEIRLAFSALPAGTRDWFDAGGELVNATARAGHFESAFAVAGAMIATRCCSPADGPSRTIALARTAHMMSYPRLWPLAEEALRGAQAEAAGLRGDEPVAIAQVRSAEWAYGMATGEFAPALRAAREALRLFESVGDMRNVSSERVSELISLRDLGLFGELIDRAPKMIADASALGLPFSVALMRMALGSTLYELGELGRAKNELELSVAWLAPRAAIEAVPRIYLAFCALADGDVQAAQEHGERIVARGREFLPAVPAGLMALARVALLRGEREEAMRLAEEALEGSAGALFTETLVRLTYIEVQEALGNQETANRQLATLKAILRARAERIDDPTWRAAFLAANAALLERGPRADP